MKSFSVGISCFLKNLNSPFCPTALPKSRKILYESASFLILQMTADGSPTSWALETIHSVESPTSLKEHFTSAAIARRLRAAFVRRIYERIYKPPLPVVVKTAESHLPLTLGAGSSPIPPGLKFAKSQSLSSPPVWKFSWTRFRPSSPISSSFHFRSLTRCTSNGSRCRSR